MFALISCSPWCRALAEWRQTVLIKTPSTHPRKTVQGCSHNVDRLPLRPLWQPLVPSQYSSRLVFTCQEKGVFIVRFCMMWWCGSPWFLERKVGFPKNNYISQSWRNHSVGMIGHSSNIALSSWKFYKSKWSQIFTIKWSFLDWIPTMFFFNSFTTSYIYNILCSYSPYYPLTPYSYEQTTKFPSPQVTLFLCFLLLFLFPLSVASFHGWVGIPQHLIWQF